MIERRSMLGFGVGFALTVPFAPAEAHDLAVAPPRTGGPLANRFGRPFTLTDHTGARVSNETYRGRFMLVYFGFTRCEDTCPVDMPIIAGTLDALGPLAEKIVPLFITVDPAHDTPDVLKRYVEVFHPRFVGLTGSEAEIADVARGYRVHRYVVTRPRNGPGPSHTISHGSLTFLMGPDSGFVALIPHNTPVNIRAETLRKYIAGGKN